MQRRLRQAGRIRIGAQVAASNGKKRPSKLETFRLTSADQRAIDAAAALYGGSVHQWVDAPVGEQWELFTETALLPVVIPPADTAFSQWYEVWGGGGCLRRCDGARDVIGDQACVCDPANRECKPHTRLNVMLRDLPGVGVWRLDTSGYYAATELAGVSELLIAAATRGQLLPATLRLEQRQVKKPGEQTKNFAVPVLDLDLHLGQIGLLAGYQAPAIEAGTVTEIHQTFRPVPVAELAAPPSTSIADQVANAGKDRKPRANSAAPVKSTGLKPRGMKPPPTDDAMPPPGISDPQKKKMMASFGDLEIADRDVRLSVTASLIGRTVASASELSKDEASKVIDGLDMVLDGRAGLVFADDGTVGIVVNEVAS
jgi:hypothetical protein